MASIFTRIIEGDLPAYKVAEDDRFIAFLDIRPVYEGHTLVVPKQETDYIFDLPDELLSDLLLFARPVARAIKQVVACYRIGLIVEGTEVPHAHLHLIPVTPYNTLSLHGGHAKVSEERMKELAAAIGKHVKL